MSQKKQKKGLFGLFGFDEEDLYSLPKSFSGSGGSGYSISVIYDGKGKPVVKVEVHGDVDVAELRRDIERRYPGAKVEGLDKQPLIRIVDEEVEARRKARKKEQEQKKKEKRRPKIRVVE